MTQKDERRKNIQAYMPSAEAVQAELSKAQSMDDFFGQDGIFVNVHEGTQTTLHAVF